MNGQQLKADALDFWVHLRTGDVRSLFGAGTDNSLVQLFRYALVGSSTFLVDYVLLLVLTRAGVATVPASGISFAAGIVCNFLLTKFFAFKAINPDLLMFFHSDGWDPCGPGQAPEQRFGLLLELPGPEDDPLAGKEKTINDNRG